MTIEITGLEAKQGETVFAICVMRLARAVDRDGLLALFRRLAPLEGPVLDELMGSLPPQLPENPRLVSVPWVPPPPERVGEQLSFLREAAAELGIERAWCFQVGTHATRGLDDDDDEDDDDEDDDDEDDDDEDDDDESKDWSHGVPPAAREVRFPVDGYPDII